MKIVLFGATGMVGSAVLRECLLADDITAVLLVARRPITSSHPKLSYIEHSDFKDFSAIQAQLQGYDACLYCLGISSVGLSEQEYTTITYDYALAAAQALLAGNPTMQFVFVSGEGADSAEKSPIMWARIKGKTENALRALPFRAIYVIRPGLIVPKHGIVSRTLLYRWLYTILTPALPVLQFLLGKRIVTSEQLGQAMLTLLRKGFSQPILHNPELNQLCPSASLT